jgi:hypothetical protein
MFLHYAAIEGGQNAKTHDKIKHIGNVRDGKK